MSQAADWASSEDLPVAPGGRGFCGQRCCVVWIGGGVEDGALAQELLVRER